MENYMEYDSNKLKLLKEKMNQNKYYLDIGYSFIDKKLEGIFLIFEQFDASEIEIKFLLELIKKNTDIDINHNHLLKMIEQIKKMFCLSGMQIFSLDILNNNKVKIYFFEKNKSFEFNEDLNILMNKFNYKNPSYEKNWFKEKYLCFGFTLDLSKECEIENYKVYYKKEKVNPNEPYINMISLKKEGKLEKYEYYLCKDISCVYRGIRKKYGIDIVKDLPDLTNHYKLSEIQVAENHKTNKKINLYYFDNLNEND